MKKLLTLALAALTLAGCTSIDCSIDNTVMMQVRIKGATDTLNVSALRSGEADTLLYNRGVSTDSLQLPMSYMQQTDSYRFVFKDAAGQVTADTLSVSKTNEPRFESVDCSPQYFHTLTAVSSTHHFIDSVVINNSQVTNHVSSAHLLIYTRRSGL